MASQKTYRRIFLGLSYMPLVLLLCVFSFASLSVQPLPYQKQLRQTELVSIATSQANRGKVSFLKAFQLKRKNNLKKSPNWLLRNTVFEKLSKIAYKSYSFYRLKIVVSPFLQFLKAIPSTSKTDWHISSLG